MRVQTERYSVFKHSSPFAIVHRIFSQVVKISPNAASTAVFPDQDIINSKLISFTKEDNKYTSILEYLIAKGKQHKIEIKKMTYAEFRKFILKLSTIEETEWVNVIPENNMEKLLIKLLKIKR